MDALSPDGLVRVTPLEKLCGRFLTRWVGESDFIRDFVDALSPDGLVRVTLLEILWMLFHQMGRIHWKINAGVLSPDGLVKMTPLGNFVDALS